VNEDGFSLDFMTNYAAVKSLHYLGDSFALLNPEEIIMKFQSNNGGLCFGKEKDESSLVPTYLGSLSTKRDKK